MVLVKQTQTQLRLLHRPYLVWIVTGSLVFGIPSLIMLISLNYGLISNVLASQLCEGTI
jgi:hypothetical protein